MAIEVNTGVQEWIRHLNDEHMPGFSHTVFEVNNAINNENTSAKHVANAILKDPSLTSRLLKLVNSFYYYSSGKKINTISKAVTILGFEKVRASALSLTFIDALVAGKLRNKLAEEIALSFHAAVQAQEMATQIKLASPESIFVATLLSRIGNMAFWAFSSEQANKVLEMIEAGELEESQIETDILGFTLRDLTKGLCKSWSLGEVLEKALDDEDTSKDDDLVVTLMQTGQALAIASLSESGWDSDEIKNIISEAADKLNIKKSILFELTKENAKKAKKIVSIFGVDAAGEYIPQPEIESREQKTAIESAELDSVEVLQSDKADTLDNQSFNEASNKLKLSILNDISTIVQEDTTINVVIDMTLNGLQRGVGMDRSLFALLSKDRKKLTCKYAIGSNSQRLRNDFVINLTSSNEVFNRVLKSKKAIKVSQQLQQSDTHINESLLKIIGKPPYLIMPAIVKGKVIGIYWSDRSESKRPISDEDFLSFQQFCQQANMGLTFLTMKG